MQGWGLKVCYLRFTLVCDAVFPGPQQDESNKDKVLDSVHIYLCMRLISSLSLCFNHWEVKWCLRWGVGKVLISSCVFWYLQIPSGCTSLAFPCNIWIYQGTGFQNNGTPLQYSCLENPMDGGAWKAVVHGVVEGWTQLSDFTFTFHFHALEKEMTTHSSVLAWRIPGMGEPGGLLSMGSHRIGHDWSDLVVVLVGFQKTP